jgi:hypothetical protein
MEGLEEPDLTWKVRPDTLRYKANGSSPNGAAGNSQGRKPLDPSIKACLSAVLSYPKAEG